MDRPRCDRGLTVRVVAGEVVARLDDATRPDLATVDRLAWLCVLARRHGLRVRVEPVTDELRDLLCLAGLDEVILGPDR